MSNVLKLKETKGYSRKEESNKLSYLLRTKGTSYRRQRRMTEIRIVTKGTIPLTIPKLNKAGYTAIQSRTVGQEQ